MDNWLDTICNATQLVAMMSAVAFVLIGASAWWRGQRAPAARVVLMGLIAAGVAVPLHLRWNARHNTFHQLEDLLSDIRGNCPAPNDARLQPVAATLPLEIDPSRQLIIWRGFSLRRHAIYDCRTGQFSTR